MLHVSTHPLVQHKVALLRHVDTGPKKFRELVQELTLLLGYEATADLPIEPTEIPTPMGRAPGQRLRGELALVPILRAGLGMVEPLLTLFPAAQVWHIGLYRDEHTLEPVEYYRKLPGSPVSMAIVLDPMLATGGSTVRAIEMLRSSGCQRIRYVGLLAAPEGVARVCAAYPEVDLYVAACDERLNDIGYIVPGLGDAGDRQFGTS